MEPSSLLLLFAVLACPIGMGVMMWLMNKNMGSQPGHSMSGDQQPVKSAERLATLRAQRQALEAEIAETARTAELEAQRASLLAGRASGPEEVSASVAQRAD